MSIENKQIVALFGTVFTSIVLVGTFLFALVYDWSDKSLLLMSDGGIYDQTINLASEKEELLPLKPSQEDLVLQDSNLSAAEVLGLDEQVEQLQALTPAQTEAKRTPASAPSVVNLPAPIHLQPSRLVDLRRHSTIHFHWDAVTGASMYRIQAWQIVGSKTFLLVDAQTDQTEIRVEPKYIPKMPAHYKVKWKVASVDASHSTNSFTDPLVVEILANPHPSR